MKPIKLIIYIGCIALFYTSCKKDNKMAAPATKPVGLDTFKTLTGTWIKDSGKITKLPKNIPLLKYNVPTYQIILKADSTYAVTDTSLMYFYQDQYADIYPVYGLKMEVGKWKLNGKILVFMNSKMSDRIVKADTFPGNGNSNFFDSVGRYDTVPIGNCSIDSISANYLSITTLKGQWLIYGIGTGNPLPVSTPLTYYFKKE